MSAALVSRVEDFSKSLDMAVDGVWSAPGRVNLIGEHTDYNEGFVLPFGIEQRTVVAMGRRDDRIIRVHSKQSDTAVEVSLNELSSDALSGWSAYPLGVAWALGEAGFDLSGVSGLDVVIDSDVPLGAGLSSSAAIECAVAIGLRDVWGFSTTDQELARICQRAENIAVGAPTGIMDQSVSLMAKDGHALFLDCRSLEIDAIPFDLQSDGLAIVVMDTQVKHSHANGAYSARRASCEKAVEALGVDALRDATIEQLEAKRGEMDDETYRRARHIITEHDRVLNTVSVLKADGPRAIGDLLVASHVSMRDDFQISCPELNLAVDTALSAGAVGARMTGGGFGGAAIALMESAHAENLIARVEAAFADAGYYAPVCFSVIASEGAKRESL
ncbi:MAG: galactokinase [Pontimonas sp.]